MSYIDMNQPWIYMYSPSRSPLPPPSPPNPSGSSQYTRSKRFKKHRWWALNGHWHFLPVWKWCLLILGNCLRFLMLISKFFFQFSFVDLLLTALLNWSSKFLIFFLYYFSRLLIFLFSWTFFPHLWNIVLYFYHTFNFHVLFLFFFYVL